ncbi:MAG TPA: 4Fe-4S binding protein [Firmicutes bacterium]|jgi:pyruvate ferredoxin oxidoreductase delta subunit|nr:4Fe-4S binding protein [Bacillota bacterium]
MTWDIEKIQDWKWTEHPPGGVIKAPGNSRQFKTGGWRAFRPVRDENKCSQCLVCYVFCPDSAIITKDDKVVEIDYRFCKGCGICAQECPRDAIEMRDETGD